MKYASQASNFFYWLKTLTKFTSVQLIAQILSFASGLLLIRTLSKQDYAYFTLANSMQGTMNLLADSGLSTALAGMGGKFWQDSYKFGQLINTALRLRRYLGVIVVMVITPILIWLLYENNASTIYIILLTAGVLIELNFYLTNSVFLTVPRLHSQIDRIQKLDLIFAVSRLLMLGIAYFSFLNAVVAVFISTISTGLQKAKLSKWVTDTIDINAPINKEYEENIISIVKPQVPIAIFYCLQGQITVWLMSIFGNAEQVAEVGALSRFIVIFSIVNSIFNSIFIPSFSRCQLRKPLLRKYLQILGIYLLISIIIIAIVAVFPERIIFILGGKYAHLEQELILSVTATLFTQIVGVMWLLNASKAWVHYGWLNIPLTLIFQVLLILILDVGTIRGVILFSLFSQIPNFVLNIYIAYDGFNKVFD